MDHHHHPKPTVGLPLASSEPQAIDPVCGMTVNPANAKATAVHEGQTYYFCSPGCKRDFDKAPEKYATKSAG